MPIYEFKCPSCGYKLEKLCGIGESGQELTCKKCGKTGLNRVMSSFRTKGAAKNNVLADLGSKCAGCDSTDCRNCGG